MDTYFLDFVNIVFRMVHIVAGIMWIGNSLLFTWIEINLNKNDENEESLGEMNMLHGGGIFFLEKRIINPEEIPRRLHIFKWQSYTTWISGFILLAALFYTRGGSLLLDPSKSNLPSYMGAVISFLSIIGGWAFYDLVWRSPIKKYPKLGILLCITALLSYAVWLDGVFNGRALYLQMGVMLGTLMSANVFFHIMTNQNKMMSNLLSGKEHDLSLGKNAKTRSLHNHYITFPVIFLMLSAHFPTLYGSERNISIIAIIIIGLAIIKHMMNCYRTHRWWKEIIYATFIIGTLAVVFLVKFPNPLSVFSQKEALIVADPQIEEGKNIFAQRGCIACHLPQDSTIGPSLHGLIGKKREFTDGSTLIADENYIRESILYSNIKNVRGFSPTMPPFEGLLTEQELQALIAYLKSLKN